MAIKQRREIADGMLTVGVADDGNGKVVALRGELDLANAATLETALEAAMEVGTKVVVDMRELEFIDSTGIALLIAAMSSDGGSPRLTFVPSEFPAVNRVLELTGLTERMALAD